MTKEKVIQLTIPTPFAIGDVQVYLLKGDTLSLIDAGINTDEALCALKHQLRELGYVPGDIEQLILTHHHPDHIGLIEHFPRIKSIIADKNVDVWLKREENFIRKSEAFFHDLFRSSGIPKSFNQALSSMRSQLKLAGIGELTGSLKEGDAIPGHPEWQVIETKGHAQTHLSFWRATDGTFIGGDHLLAGTSSNPLIEAPYHDEVDRAKPMLQYRASLKKCLTLDIQKVYPGHGRIITEVEELIKYRLQKQEQRSRQVIRLLKHEKLTPFQICQHLFPAHYKQQIELTMSETLGQLDFLEEHGKVELLNNDGFLYYRVKD